MPIPITRLQTTIIRATEDNRLLVDHWEFIRRGLIAVKTKSTASRFSDTPMSYWEPGNVRAAVIAGFANDMTRGAELWLGFPSPLSMPSNIAAPAPCGFAVTNTNFEPFLQIPYAMFVWIAYSDPLVKSDVVQTMERALTDVARVRGLEYLEAMTKRVGLPERLARLGWKKHMIVIRKPLFADIPSRDVEE